MEMLLQAVEKHLPRLNVKAYDFEDVETLAARHHINLKICDYNPDILGYFCIRKTPKRVKKYIVINSMLGPVDRTFIGLHELAHYFLHVPMSARQYFFCRRNARLTEAKHDAEANAVALVAMVPLWMLIDHEATEFANLHPGLINLLKRRKQLFELHGI